MSLNRGERGSHHGGPQLQEQQQTAGPDEGEDEEQLQGFSVLQAIEHQCLTITCVSGAHRLDQRRAGRREDHRQGPGRGSVRWTSSPEALW